MAQLPEDESFIHTTLRGKQLVFLDVSLGRQPGEAADHGREGHTSTILAWSLISVTDDFLSAVPTTVASFPMFTSLDVHGKPCWSNSQHNLKLIHDFPTAWSADMHGNNR